MENQWQGKRVAFLGDSITDAIHVGTTKNYWQYLQEYLGVVPMVYGINGQQWAQILPQAEKLYSEKGMEVDAICIFAGTNDFNGAVPLGEWWQYAQAEANYCGRVLTVRRRTPNMDPTTLRGRINIAMSYIKKTFPVQQVFLLTPIHRGFATFSDVNVQPDETFPNRIGLYIDEYVQVLKEAGTHWAVPVIDLNSVSGLYPLTPEHKRFFHLEDTDMLHPNAEGHRRIALAMMYQMLALPADFR